MLRWWTPARGWIAAIVVLACAIGTSAVARAAVEPAREPEPSSLLHKPSPSTGPVDLDRLHAQALALLHEEQRYAQADALLARECALRREAEGRSHALLACLSQRGFVRWRTRELDEALEFFEQSLAILRELGIPEDTHVWILNLVAAIYNEQFHTGEALRLYERVLAIHERTDGPQSMKVSTTLSLMALVYTQQGAYEDAIGLLERALSIREAQLGPEHRHVADVLRLLAPPHVYKKEYEQAEALLERTLAIHEQASPNSPEVAVALVGLGWLCLLRGEYEQARSLLERALPIFEKAAWPNDRNMADNLIILSGVYRLQGEYDRAQSMLERALTILEQRGPDHPDVALGLHHLGLLHARRSRADLAVPLHRRGLDIEYNHLTRTLLFAEEHRRLDYAATISASLDIVISLHLDTAPDDPVATTLALTTILRRRGLVREIGARTLETIRRSLSPKYHAVLDELSRSRARYAALTGPRGQHLLAEVRARTLATVRDEQRRLWHTLSIHSTVTNTLPEAPTIAAVQRALPSDGVLVEFVRYTNYNRARGSSAPLARHYAAYLVFSDHWEGLDLGPVATIEALVDDFRQRILHEQPTGPDLYRAVVAPVVARLGDARRLLIVPDGALGLVPFAALYDGEHYLVEQYPLVLLSTGRDLLRPRQIEPPPNDTAVIVANPTGAGAPLPGTEHEASLITTWFPHAQTVMRDQATETRMRALQGPRLLHIGTHGFYDLGRPNPTVDTVAEVPQHPRSFRNESGPALVDDPMLLSGVMLAAPRSPPTALGRTPVDDEALDDGRLTAYEASGLDLRGTELVVLSACGTGLGTLLEGSSEGIMGLRRGFALAGAQTVVTSLWNLSDDSAPQVMTRFYENLAHGLGRADAMQQAQLDLLATEDLRSPLHWAPFIVTGDWRPLSGTPLPTTMLGAPPAIEPTRGCRASIAATEPPSAWVLVAVFGLVVRRRKPGFGHPVRRPIRRARGSLPSNGIDSHAESNTSARTHAARRGLRTAPSHDRAQRGVGLGRCAHGRRVDPRRTAPVGPHRCQGLGARLAGGRARSAAGVGGLAAEQLRRGSALVATGSRAAGRGAHLQHRGAAVSLRASIDAPIGPPATGPADRRAPGSRRRSFAAAAAGHQRRVRCAVGVGARWRPRAIGHPHGRGSAIHHAGAASHLLPGGSLPTSRRGLPGHHSG